MPSEMYLLQHGLTHDCSPSRDVFAPSWAYPQPHPLADSSTTSSTATGVASPARTYPWATIPSEVQLLCHRLSHGHRCCQMFLPWHGFNPGPQMPQGVQLPHGLTHRSQALPLEFPLEFQPVQNGSRAAAALAICQPRHIARAVIKLFPGTAE